MARSAKSRRLLSKDYRAEVKAIQKSARKRGLFASVGGFLGGALATALTGGAAAPMVAAMMAGGGNYMGRKLGAVISKTDIKKAGGGKFAQSARNDLVSQLGEQDLVSGLKGGLFAAIGQMGGLSKILGKGKDVASASSTASTVASSVGTGNIKIASEGLKQGIFPKGTFAKLFKSSDPKALASQKGLGSLIDFRGSAIGEGLGKMQASMALSKVKNLQVGEGLVPTVGSITGVGSEVYDPSSITRGGQFNDGVFDLDKLYQDELGLAPTEGFLDQDVYRAQADQINPYGSFDIRKSPAVDAAFAPSKIVPSGTIPEPAMGKGLSMKERGVYDTINKLSDEGYSLQAGDRLPQEFGRGFMDDSGALVREPSRPSNMPADPGYNEGFSLADKDIEVDHSATREWLRPDDPVDPGYGNWGGDIKDTIIDKDPAFTNFNEASWAEGRERINEATKQAYWGSETPAVEALTGGPVGTGFTSEEELVYGRQPAMSQLGVDLSKYDLLQESTTKANKLRQDASRYKRLFGNRKGI